MEWGRHMRKALSTKPGAVWSRRYYRALRSQVLTMLGGVCVACKDPSLQWRHGSRVSNRPLELHHKDYVKGESVHDGHGTLRLLEARAHPERFTLVCKQHHNFWHAALKARVPSDAGMSKRLKVALIWSARRQITASNDLQRRVDWSTERGDEPDPFEMRIMALMSPSRGVALFNALTEPRQSEHPVDKMQRRLSSPLDSFRES